MGGGGLRILGHKKWHVWRRDNIERVLRDEREHEEQQRAAREQQRWRDHEARADALGVHLFEREEAAHARALLTGDDGATHKAQQRGAETLGRHARLPWYATAGEADHGGSVRDERVKESTLDPLRNMRPPRAAEEIEADEVEDARARRRREGKKRRRRDERDRDENENETKKRKTPHKHEKKRKRRHSNSEDSDSKDNERQVLLERLRRERHEREAIERERVERLMRGH